ncbi:MAG TPA: phenylalanine--tRNA ligase subunit beta [bacterium]|nr:phenylalanine--tRNA ligase subunit beta [bacterium]HQI48872.1 phenylalanine--tRNA ligase subunit beta [bacterium]HQJ64749.1 phenylalanine--tRNA ligase subunit beta [bacterium]
MKVTLSWLKEFVDISLSMQELSHTLTMTGLEVESVEEIARPFSGVVASRIIRCAPHPQADKLQICRVDAGRGEELDVVCGAPNARAGLLVPLALPGAVLDQTLKVSARKIRGVSSSGMLCSEAELGLTDRAEGLMLLDGSAQPGQDLLQWLGEPDYLLDIFITPNRPDCLSVIGLAREIAAATRRPLRLPKLVSRTVDQAMPPRIPVTIEAPELCPRYSGLYFETIRLQPAPFWMAYRLHHAGVRSINCVVDITNYVMLEYGQPLHAFDAAYLSGQRLVVRAAAAGEAFTTLDGKNHTIEAGTCLICDGEKPIALAGIMGGLNSEVQPTTTAVFLESAHFAALGIRKSSKQLAISTESSRRFERGADPEGTLPALDRASGLLEALTGATPVGGSVDCYPQPLPRAQIDLRLSAVKTLIGVELSAAEVIEILERLEITCAEKSADLIACIVPPFRPDLTRPVDLIEEVARIYGYDQIPFAQTVALDQSQTANPRVAFQDQVRHLLAGFGLHETLSLSLVSPQAAAPFLPANSAVVELLNPLSTEWSVFRTNLLISLLQNAAYNRNRQMPNLRFFEIGNVAWKRGDRFEEEKQVAGLLVGETGESAWYGKPRAVDFYDIKGLFYALIEQLGIQGVTLGVAQGAYWAPESAGIYLKDQSLLGSFGRLSEAVLQSFKLKTADCFGLVLSFDQLYAHRLVHRRFQPIARFPMIPFDIALLLDDEIAVGAVEQAIRESGGEYLVKVHLFDYYQGEQVPKGKKSVAFSLNFCSKERTLGVNEVEQQVAAILARLSAQFGAELRPR